MQAKWKYRTIFVLFLVTLAALLIATSWTKSPTAAAAADAPGELAGKVQLAGNPIADSMITLYDNGSFKLNLGDDVWSTLVSDVQAEPAVAEDRADMADFRGVEPTSRPRC